MKNIITCISFLSIIVATSFAQQTNTPPSSTREDYLQKSKNQKTAAWILLGGGTALIATGVLIGNGKRASFGDAATGGVIGAIGVLSAIGSIPLFIASAKNKRRGNAATAYLKIEGVPAIPGLARIASFSRHFQLRFVLVVIPATVMKALPKAQ